MSTITEKIKFDDFGPEMILEVYDSKTKMHGFLVIDNTALGPGKGGIRMTPTVSIEEVFRLARTMTWKCSITNLSFGGAKSGIVANPKKISKDEKRVLIKAFARALKPVSPRLYIAAPDVNTGEEEMRWYAEANGSWRSCTGKPKNMCYKPGERCGIPHEFGSTGFGVAVATRVAAEHDGVDLESSSIAIEGFGNVGSFTSKFLSESGAMIVAVSDSKGCIYNPDGLDYEKLMKVKKETRSVINYKPGKKISTEELFGLPVDILIPAALSDSININNMNKIKARIIVEAANIPTTPRIEEIFHRKGILVVPDFVANAGGVISSYAEYKGYHLKKMFTLVENKIKRNTKIVLKRSDKENIKPRDAALKTAKERVRKAMEKKTT